jgi:hypothetical protein
MQARHFADWNCGTPGCEYSREGQRTEMATTFAAIEAMREASTSARFEVSLYLGSSDKYGKSPVALAFSQAYFF